MTSDFALRPSDLLSPDGQLSSAPERSAVCAVSVVVVTFNSAAVLRDCLLSLADGCRDVKLVEVVVADNSSADESVTIAESISDLPIRVVQVGRNAGYSAAINQAVHSMDTTALDAVLVLNPDTRLRPGAIAVLARSLRERGRGITVPRLVNTDGTLQPSLRWPPSVTRALAVAVLGGGRASRYRRLGELITDPERYQHPGRASWATGAVMLLSTKLIQDIGDWDESFLLYSEEAEYAFRAADRGWELWYEPSATVEHIGGECDTNPMLAALLAVNRVQLYRRRNGRLAGAAFFAATTLGEAVRATGGRRTSRAALRALLRPSTRLRSLPG